MKKTFRIALALLAIATGAATGYAADNPNEIVSRYRSAHQSKSIDGVAKLVRFRTQDSTRRASWLKEVTATFSSKIATIKLVPFSEYAFMLPESDRKLLPATTKPENWMLIEFAPRQPDTGRTESTSYLIGVENGTHFIIGP